jgi:trigger factor
LSSTEAVENTTPETETGIDPVPEASEHTHEHVHTQAEQGPALNPECVRDVEVVIPAEEVSAAFRRVVKNYGRQARIPGFRAGKVPPTLIRSRFDEQIRQDVVEQLLPQHFRAAIDAKGLQPISQPQVTELELQDGQPLRFKALFEVLPEIALDGWQDIHVPREPIEVADQEFEAEMDRMLDSRSTMEPVEEDRTAISPRSALPARSRSVSLSASRSSGRMYRSKWAARTPFRPSPRRCAAPSPGKN